LLRMAFWIAFWPINLHHLAGTVLLHRQSDGMGR
jgi:hypothetical protein